MLETRLSRRPDQDKFALFRVEQADYKVHDRPGREELAEFATEHGSQESFEGEAFDIVCGL